VAPAGISGVWVAPSSSITWCATTSLFLNTTTWPGETFAGFGSFAVRVDGEHHVVDVSAIARDVDGDVVAEFCNFALANTAIRRKTSHV